MLFDLVEIDAITKFPSTRYQGSKQKYADWIWYCIQYIPFGTVLDAFGGTGCIAHLLKREGKTVTYNDILKFNSIIGKALIENDIEKITPKDLAFILRVGLHNDVISHIYSPYSKTVPTFHRFY
jgi:adenine-specific DNA methylase